MRVLVCGGRDFGSFDRVCQVLDDLHKETRIGVVIHGAARGADLLAAAWASQRKVAHMPFAADWHKHGRAAGPIRNKWMLEEGKPDLVIAFPGGNGTAHMVRIAREAGVEVREITHAR